MSIFNKKQTSEKEAAINGGGLRLSLIKTLAEQNKEKFLEYNRETDTLILSEIRDGQFFEMERTEGFVGKADLDTGRIYEKDRVMYRRELQSALASPYSKTFDVRYMIPGEGPRWYRMFLMSVADETGYVTGFAARMVNIQDAKTAQKNMKDQAEHDLLSGVYNHATYERICTEYAEKEDGGLVYVMVDIDNFKTLNDTKGHHAGDEIIRHIGSVLKTEVKGCGYAGRMGGDEFSAFFYDMKSKDEVLGKCVKIKDNLSGAMGVTPFTVSIGVAMSMNRKMSFKELYFEADEAVYFAKENGKNQIIFKDEVLKKKEDRMIKSRGEYALTEEEIALDQKLQYIAIVEPIQKSILYMNESGRKALGLSLEEVQGIYGNDLFKSITKDVCELHANHAQVLTDEQAEGLLKFIPNGKFIIQSRDIIWKGISAKSITFMNVNDREHMELSMEAEMESQETFSKCWSLIMESNSGDTDYEKILKVLADYYDAQCCAIVTKDGDCYQEIFEYHKTAGNAAAEGVRSSLGQGMFERCEILLDEEGFMRPRYIEEILLEHPELAEALEKKFVHNTMGIALRKFGQIMGILLVINPRHHLSDYTMLGQLGAFFGTDLVRKKLTDNKTYEEDHDVMTRLWSRDFFNRGWQIDFLPLFKTSLGVFTADIFRLKDVNKQLGYNAGNDRIVALAELFRQVFAGYSVFRYDDDQIMAVCHSVDQRQFQKMADYAKELIDELDFPVSRGYSWKAEPLLHEAIQEAEEYLVINKKYLEKENATAEMLAKKIEKDVMEQIREGNFRMFLQPKVSISTGKTVGAEALIRLYQPNRGYIPPFKFISVLEQHNEVHLIDLFILSKAFQFQKTAKDAGKEIVPISVNFSKNTLMHPKLMEHIQRDCDTYGMPEGMIRIEITETISNMDHMEVRTIASALHTMGFSISMDDFGTQYSNMAVLTQFEFDTVKIDRSMILNIVEDEKNRTILKHTVPMLEELGMEVVIEGVETKEQVDVLAELGCDIVQGFFFGKPEAEEKFYELFM